MTILMMDLKHNIKESGIFCKTYEHLEQNGVTVCLAENQNAVWLW
jgi:hypothetical protein